MTRRLRLAVLASGGGRGLQNLIDRADDGLLPAELVAVGVSKKKAYARQRAAEAGIPCSLRSKKRGETVEDFSAAVFAELAPHKPDLICLSGYLSLLRIPERWRDRVLNIHPSLIPKYCGAGFYGSKVHAAVAAAGERVSGCTVHVCDNIYDHGPILLQVRVPIDPEAGAEAIAARVFAAELLAYPRVITGIAEGRLRLEGGAWRGVERLDFADLSDQNPA